MDAGVAENNIGLNDREVRTLPLFQQSTALFNARPLRTHYLAGMSGCMKNFNHIRRELAGLPPEQCAPFGRALQLAQVKGNRVCTFYLRSRRSSMAKARIISIGVMSGLIRTHREH